MSTLSSVPEEEYRPVVGYEGLYEVSNLGNVRSLPTLSSVPEEEKNMVRVDINPAERIPF